MNQQKQDLALSEAVLAWKVLAACRYQKSDQVITATRNLINFWIMYDYPIR